MDITNTAVEVLEHCESGEEDTILEKVDQGELEVKTTHDLPGAPQVDPYICRILGDDNSSKSN